MSVLLTIFISIVTSVLSVIGFRNLKISYYRSWYGPQEREAGRVKIVRPGGSAKVFIIVKDSRTRFWVHPKESLENIGYDVVEDVEDIDGNKLIEDYPVYRDINLTY